MPEKKVRLEAQILLLKKTKQYNWHIHSQHLKEWTFLWIYFFLTFLKT